MVIKARRLRLARDLACMGKMRNKYILVGKSEGKKPLGLYRHV
jgi:hypothetical protein